MPDKWAAKRCMLQNHFKYLSHPFSEERVIKQKNVHKLQACFIQQFVLPGHFEILMLTETQVKKLNIKSQ